MLQNQRLRYIAGGGGEFRRIEVQAGGVYKQ